MFYRFSIFLKVIFHYLKIFLRGKTLKRTSAEVKRKYNNTWLNEKRYAKNLNSWLKGDQNYNLHLINDKIYFKKFDFIKYNITLIKKTLEIEFPNFQSLTEYGSGAGRNIILLKKIYPKKSFYGYELTNQGVKTSVEISKKFNINVKYSELNFINPQKKLAFPKTDIGLTMFALEQIPESINIKKSLTNILNNSKLGSIHLEPVIENYPDSIHGDICKHYHNIHDYLKNFEMVINELAKKKVLNYKKILIKTSFNPFIYPSLYIIKKK